MDQLAEDWKEFRPGYWVSRYGEVFRLRNGNKRFLKGSACGQVGYLLIVYSSKRTRDGKKEHKRFYIHRAVCEAFNGPSNRSNICRHLDGNHLNNTASNLAWGTCQDNSQDMIAHGRSPIGEKNPMARLDVDMVERMRMFRKKTGLSYKRIGEEFGVSTMTAYRAVVKQSWSHV